MRIAVISAKAVHIKDPGAYIWLGDITEIVGCTTKPVEQRIQAWAQGQGIGYREMRLEPRDKRQARKRDQRIVEEGDEVFLFWDGRMMSMIALCEYASSLGKGVHLIRLKPFPGDNL